MSWANFFRVLLRWTLATPVAILASLTFSGLIVFDLVCGAEAVHMDQRDLKQLYKDLFSTERS